MLNKLESLHKHLHSKKKSKYGARKPCKPRRFLAMSNQQKLVKSPETRSSSHEGSAHSSVHCHALLESTFQIDVIVVRSLKHVGTHRDGDGLFRPISVDEGDCDAA